MYEAGFTVRSLARAGVIGGMRGLRILVSSDKGLTEVGRMAEGD